MADCWEEMSNVGLKRSRGKKIVDCGEKMSDFGLRIANFGYKNFGV